MENIETKDITYRKALKEVYLIINNLAEELYFKIPKSFIELVRTNMDNNYNITLEKINKNGELKETKTILALIYRDYLCEENIRKQLIEQEKQDMQAEYNKYNNMFKKPYTEQSNEDKQLIVVKQENWFIKLLNKIKHIFIKS